MKLVIVESPAKAKTIGRFLGKNYIVEASFGHVRDLPSSASEIPKGVKDAPWARLGVDVEGGYKPIYVVQAGSRKHIAELKKKLKEASEVVLATDEDREGESISWHLLETLEPKVPVKRIVFHEITKEAIDEAVANPRDVDMELVKAQESRRILDRLYGYSLSPVLWKKVRPKLSAGRVQSVAVRLVVEREEARRAFKISNYWDIETELEAQGKRFQASLVEVGGKRVASGRDFDADTGELKSNDVAWLQADNAAALAAAMTAAEPWKVVRVEQKDAKLRPYPPFITSTLQQSASAVLGFSPRLTMQIAQRLYEGEDLGNGEREGLITYMRTDSVTLSEKALGEAGVFIKREFGERYYDGPRRYSTKSKMAQEAHEAIRPTHISRRPEDVAPYLDAQDLKLYRLIWNRTVASQMADAEMLKTTVDILAASSAGDALLRANGSVVTFPGFLRVADSGQRDVELPPVKEGMGVGKGQAIAVVSLAPASHETKPPARYTEATLVKRLEEEGIGRPSTYAPTIAIIQQRGYVEKRNNSLAPTYLGIAVTSLLRKHFSEYVDLQFTARMEDALDDIAEGHADWIAFLDAFFRGKGDFGPGLEPQIEHEMDQIDFPAIPLGNDSAGVPVVVRLGKTAPFVQRGDGGGENTATVPDSLPYDELTVEKALELLETKGQRNEALGKDPATGQDVFVLVGPYGPYVQLGENGEGGKKPKRVGLPKGAPVESVTYDVAMKYLALPRALGKHPESGKSVVANNGRFGPYVGCDGEFRSIPKNEDMFTITLERALALLAQPKGVRKTKTLLRELGKHPGNGAAVELYEGRYGPYVTNGEVNATLPKELAPEAVTLEKAVELLRAAPAKAKARTRAKAAARKAPAKKAAAKKKPAG